MRRHLEIVFKIWCKELKKVCDCIIATLLRKKETARRGLLMVSDPCGLYQVFQNKIEKNYCSHNSNKDKPEKNSVSCKYPMCWHARMQVSKWHISQWHWDKSYYLHKKCYSKWMVYQFCFASRAVFIHEKSPQYPMLTDTIWLRKDWLMFSKMKEPL